MARPVGLFSGSFVSGRLLHVRQHAAVYGIVHARVCWSRRSIRRDRLDHHSRWSVSIYFEHHCRRCLSKVQDQPPSYHVFWMFLDEVINQTPSFSLFLLFNLTLSGSSGVALTYFSVQHSYYMVVITFSGIVGLGVGFGYLGPLSIAMKVSCSINIWTDIIKMFIQVVPRE